MSFNLLLLLPIVVSGYVLHYTRAFGLFWPQQKDGQSYFRILLIGSLWFWGTLPLVPHIPIEWLSTSRLDDWFKIPEVMLVKPILIAIAIRLILDFLFSRIEESSDKIKQYYEQKVMSRTFLSRYLYDFVVNTRWVLITLKNDKAYVGQIVKIPEPPVDWIRIYPLRSGYRDERKKLHLETDYLKAIKQIIESLEHEENSDSTVIDEIALLIPMDQIVSIQRYDPSLKQYFSESGSPQAEKLTQQPQ